MQIEIKGVKRMMKQLDPKIVKKATAKTLNDMAAASKTEIKNKISEKYTLPKGRIGKGIRIIVNATTSRLYAIISFLGRPPGLQHYKAKEVTAKGIQYSMGKYGMVGKKLKRGKATKGVSIEIIKGKRKTVRKAFLAVMRAGGSGVWKHSPNDQNKRKIERLFGPSIKGMFNALRGRMIIQQVLKKRLEKTFWRHYDFYKGKNKK